MAINDTITVPAQAWTQLTNADATNVSIQNLSVGYILIKATVDTTAPATKVGAVRLFPGEWQRATLAAMFPGIALPVRLWAFCDGSSPVFISG